MFKDNPILVESLVITDDEQLAQLVKLLTGATEVSIECEDIGAGCVCCSKRFRRVEAIYVTKDGIMQTLSANYPQVAKELKEIGINTKIVW